MTMPSSSRVSPNGQSSFGNRIKERERERRKKTELRSSTAYKSILLLLSWFHEQKKNIKKMTRGLGPSVGARSYRSLLTLL